MVAIYTGSTGIFEHTWNIHLNLMLLGYVYSVDRVEDMPALLNTTCKVPCS